jgi:hypothetical protein
VFFDRLAELAGQRNAIDAQIVQIVAEIDRDASWALTGARSLPAMVAWKLGVSPSNAHVIAAVAHRLEELQQCSAGMREGRFSLDQVGVIAQRAGIGSDAHYAELVGVATVTQLRTAVKLEPKPPPDADTDAPPAPSGPPRPQPPGSISRTSDEQSSTWRITLPPPEAATFEAALQSHTDALVAAWKRDRAADGADGAGDQSASGTPPMPSTIDGFLSLIEAGWDSDVAARPHGQRTTVVVHLDLADRIAALHLGPLLTDDDRRYLSCDATCEVWFEREGRPIGSGRETRTVNRRLRRALERRDQCCVIPGCGATRGLHAHHLTHWQDGGPTELPNLVLLCPYHHRLYHRGGITLAGDAEHLVVTDDKGRPLHPGSLARPPTAPPPEVPPCTGPLGERADWWWYDPYEPTPPPSTN